MFSVGKLTQAGIDVESKGGQWLLLFCEEASLNPDKHFNIMGFVSTLYKGSDKVSAFSCYKSASVAATHSLRCAGIPTSLKKFINQMVN